MPPRARRPSAWRRSTGTTSRSGASWSKRPGFHWSKTQKKRSRPGGRLLGVEPPSREGEGMAQGDFIVEVCAARVMSRGLRICCSHFATMPGYPGRPRMSTVPNHTLRQLRAGKLAIGLGVAEAARVANQETRVVVMIESPRGVAQADEIAAVKGADALLIGTNDLCFEIGIPGQFNAPRVAEAYKKVIAACRKHGKFPGMGGMYTPELLERHIAMGVQLILSGSDFSLLMQAGKARADLVRGFEKGS